MHKQCVWHFQQMNITCSQNKSPSQFSIARISALIFVGMFPLPHNWKVKFHYYFFAVLFFDGLLKSTDIFLCKKVIKDNWYGLIHPNKSYNSCCIIDCTEEVMLLSMSGFWLLLKQHCPKTSEWIFTKPEWRLGLWPTVDPIVLIFLRV